MGKIKILSIRERNYGKPYEFLRGSSGTITKKITNIIENTPNGEYDFLISIDGKKMISTSEKLHLENKIVEILESGIYAAFCGDQIDLIDHKLYESLPQESTVAQLKKLRKLTKGVDIGDRISDMNAQGANIQYIKNPIDTGIESFQDFEKKNKKFRPSWNLKHIDPYGD